MKLRFVLVMCCLLVLPALAGAEPGARSVVRGLEMVDLDSWVSTLYSGAPTGAPPSEAELRAGMLRAFEESTDVHQFFSRLASMKLPQTIRGADDAVTIARALLSARREIRASAKAGTEAMSPSLPLLETMVNEVLYASKVRHKNPAAQVKLVFDPRSVKEALGEGSSVRETRIQDLPLWQGDILLSKGDAGSSSFLARVGDRPGSYSHATIAYLDPANGRLLFPEAEIEDGVKLRDPKKDYMDPPGKRRLSIYRRTDMAAKASDGVDSLVAKMRARVADPEHQASFAYNFSFLPEGGTDPKALYCTETVCLPYSLGGVEDSLSPYPRDLWSQVSGVKEEMFKDFFNIPVNRFPAPSDLDRNPSYELVGTVVDLNSLGDERVDAALIDSLVSIIESRPETFDHYLEAVKGFGNGQITREQLDRLTELKLLSPEKIAKIRASVPENINLKQLIFFGYLNQEVTPKVRAKLRALEAAKLAKEGRPLLPSEIRNTIRTAIEGDLEAWVALVKEVLAREARKANLAPAAAACEQGFAKIGR